jgi:hypothetical protein
MALTDPHCRLTQDVATPVVELDSGATWNLQEAQVHPLRRRGLTTGIESYVELDSLVSIRNGVPPVTITADIEDLAVADFMMLLAQNRKTGQLAVQHGDNRLKLAFRDGAIIYAASTGIRETVGAMLVGRELITEQQLQVALERQKEHKGTALLGNILVEMEVVTADDLNKVVFLQFQNVIREALGWVDGVGTYTPMDIPDLGAVRVDPQEMILETGFRAEQILLGGAAQHDEDALEGERPDYFKAVRAVLDNMKEDSIVVTSEMAAAILDDANTLVQRAILFLVYPTALSVVGAFDSDNHDSSLSLTGQQIERHDREDSVVSWVIQEGCSYQGRLKDSEGNRPLRELLGEHAPAEVILIPLIVDRTVQAVLYGDNRSEDGSIGPIGDLERVIARVAREMGEKRHE